MARVGEEIHLREALVHADRQPRSVQPRMARTVGHLFAHRGAKDRVVGALRQVGNRARKLPDLLPARVFPPEDHAARGGS